MGVAQVVERRVVVANVAGSNPVTHPRHYSKVPGRIRESPGFTVCSILIPMVSNESFYPPLQLLLFNN